MKYGLTIFPTDYTMAPDEFARRAEEMGFESVWFPEHTHIPVERKTPWSGGPELPRDYYHSYDPFVALMAAGAATREIKLATGICLIIQHDPITTAKTISTLDRLTNGRFIFGIGGGWNREEIEHHGTPFAKRFAVLRERVLAMKAMWTEDQAEFHGQHVNFEPIAVNPKPVQKPHPPIIMGGDGPTTFDRVVQFCDGWLPIGRGNMPAGLEDKMAELRRRARQQVATLHRSASRSSRRRLTQMRLPASSAGAWTASSSTYPAVSPLRSRRPSSRTLAW